MPAAWAPVCGGAFGGGLGLGLTGAGFSCGGVGIASRAIRFRSVGAGAATRFTAYTGGVAAVVRTWLTRNSAAARVDHQRADAAGQLAAPISAIRRPQIHDDSSSCATSPTFCTPAPRMTASTRTTSPYGTRVSAWRYTPLGFRVATSDRKVTRKSRYDTGV